MELQRDRLPCAGVLAALCLLPGAAAAADDTASVTAGFGGRLHLDFANFSNDDRGTPNRDDTEVRRAWLDMSGRFFVVDYKLEADFSGDRVEAKDVYVSRRFDSGRLTVGQFKQYFSLDDRTGSNYGSFLERGSAAATLAPLYRQGVSWQAAGAAHTWAASAYSLESIDAWQVKGTGVGGRATWAPRREDGDLRHLGLSLAHERYDTPGAGSIPALRIRPRPAGHLSDASRLTLVDFGGGRDVDVDKWSVEYAQVRGPWSWQGEWSGGRFDDGNEQARVRAGYAFVSWFATGESRRYDHATGRFSRIGTPNHRAGALEFALRYDRMAGTQNAALVAPRIDAATESWTLAGNWYLRPNLRLMLDLIESRNEDRTAQRTTDRTRAVTGRLQFDF